MATRAPDVTLTGRATTDTRTNVLDHLAGETFDFYLRLSCMFCHTRVPVFACPSSDLPVHTADRMMCAVLHRSCLDVVLGENLEFLFKLTGPCFPYRVVLHVYCLKYEGGFFCIAFPNTTVLR